MKVKKERIDRLLVEKGLVKTRQKALALIMAGVVFVEGKRTEKGGTLIAVSACIEVKDDPCPYVSRGGLKLEGALDYFSCQVEGKVALDVGASTGGFTHCLLKKGAKKVYAVDVGYGLLAWTLKNDSRVISLERENIRYLDMRKIKDPIDLAVIDVSFISLTKVLPKVHEIIKPGAYIIALIKPQFEVGKGEVGKGGIVKSEEKHAQVIDKIKNFGISLGLIFHDIIPSPILGAEGNKEFFIYFSKDYTFAFFTEFLDFTGKMPVPPDW